MKNIKLKYEDFNLFYITLGLNILIVYMHHNYFKFILNYAW